jgi:hypothetical protein
MEIGAPPVFVGMCVFQRRIARLRVSECSAADLIVGYLLIARAHATGLKIYGGTLTPLEGTFAG